MCLMCECVCKCVCEYVCVCVYLWVFVGVIVCMRRGSLGEYVNCVTMLPLALSYNKKITTTGVTKLNMHLWILY